jgi:hypothetical protein
MDKTLRELEFYAAGFLVKVQGAWTEQRLVAISSLFSFARLSNWSRTIAGRSSKIEGAVFRR